MSKKTGLKDKNETIISVGDKVLYKKEIYDVVKNVVPFNHYAIYNNGETFDLSKVHKNCQICNS